MTGGNRASFPNDWAGFYPLNGLHWWVVVALG